MLKAGKGVLRAGVLGAAVGFASVIRRRALCVGALTVAIAGSVAGGTAAAQSTTPPPPQTPQLQLRAILLHADPHATHLRAVRANLIDADSFLDNRPSPPIEPYLPGYLACAEGKFHSAMPAPGANEKAYPTECLVVLAQNWDVVRVSLLSRYPDLHTLGTVWKL